MSDSNPIKTLLKAPPGTGAYALFKDESSGNDVTAFIIKEDTQHINRLPDSVNVDVRAWPFSRFGVFLLVVLLRIEGKIYETWWNWYNEFCQKCFLNILSQDKLLFSFYVDDEKPQRTIWISNKLKESFELAKDNFQKFKKLKPWTMQEFDIARNELYKEYPNPSSLWIASVLQSIAWSTGQNFIKVEKIDTIIKDVVKTCFTTEGGIALCHCGLWANDRKFLILMEEIIKLEFLKELYLHGNYLTTLPESIIELKSLQNLDLSWNMFKTLPESICELKTLKELDLGANKLMILPESIVQLKSLQILSLQQNKFTTLPESIGELKSLQTLALWQNELITLPESIGELKSLQTLALWQNKLTTLPESIGELKSLQILELYSNQLSALPESIINLQSLHTLSLWNNKFTTIPESVKKLEQRGVNVKLTKKEIKKDKLKFSKVYKDARDAQKKYL